VPLRGQTEIRGSSHHPKIDFKGTLIRALGPWHLRRGIRKKIKSLEATRAKKLTYSKPGRTKLFLLTDL